MKCRAISSLGAVLIAACVVSLLATSYANPAAIHQRQSRNSMRPCCGSHGWQSSKRALSKPVELYVGRRAQNNRPVSPSIGRPANNKADLSQREAKREPESQDYTQATRPRSQSGSGQTGRTTDPVEDPGRNQRPVLQRPADVQDSERQTRSGKETEPTNAAADSSADDVIRLESTLVNISLLVSDRAGRYIPKMTKRDFVVFEDGVEQEIATFSNEEVAFNVVLLLDMSPSVRGSVEAIQDACIAFVDQMRPQDRVMVVSFDRRIRYLTDLTSDRRQLESAIRSTSTGSGTSVHDAVYNAVGKKLRNIEGRKALLLFSDGEDTTSSTSYDDAIETVSESDVLVYGLRFPAEHGGYIRIDPRYRWPELPIPIPLPLPAPRRPRGPDSTTTLGPTAPTASAQSRYRADFMSDLATAGGGPVYDAQNVGDFSRLANQIAEELRHIYMLSYYPKNKLSNGGYRTVRVRAKGNDSFAIRHRKGYNAGSVTRANTIH